MKIDSSVKPLDGIVGGARKEATRPAVSRPSPAQSDDVEISSLTTRLQGMGGTSTSSSVADSTRVDAIRQAISAGTFKIDASKIADGLIASVQEMLNAEK